MALFSNGGLMESRRILIVDDEPDILELLKETFEGTGYCVAGAQCGAEAIEVFERENPSIILSDNRMPGMSGIEFFEVIRNKGTDAVRILMTGYADLKIAIDAINRGWVYKFVAKPFKLEEILVTVQRAQEFYEMLQQKKQLEEQIRQQNAVLEKRVYERTKELRLLTHELERKNKKLIHQKDEIRDLYSQLQRSYFGSITALYFALEARDPYTRGHSERVFHYCVHTGEILGLTHQEMMNLKYAALLHDLGKIGIPDSILQKPGKLTQEEYAAIQNHPAVGATILNPIQFLKRAKDIIREHHEHYDGSGYPHGLSAERLSIQGRIIAVVDAYDAMRSDRPYRSAMSRQEAIAELRRVTGTQFCPKCVAAFEKVLEETGDFYDNPSLLDELSHELHFVENDMPGLTGVFAFQNPEFAEME